MGSLIYNAMWEYLAHRKSTQKIRQLINLMGFILSHQDCFIPHSFQDTIKFDLETCGLGNFPHQIRSRWASSALGFVLT